MQRRVIDTISLVSLSAIIGGIGCSGSGKKPDHPEPAISVDRVAHPLSQPFRQNWSGWTNGQCIVALRNFYLNGQGGLGGNRGDVGYMPQTCVQNCQSEGACHTWVNNTPDGNFNRHEMWEGVQPFDVIVYMSDWCDCADASCWTGYGHIAAVDHVDGGNIYVMDSNYNLDERAATSAHVVRLEAYGFYRLRALEPGTGGGPCSGVASGWYCGNDGLGLDANTRYLCNGSAQPASQQGCSQGCSIQPAGVDDYCYNGSCGGLGNGWYCGNDGPNGNPNINYLCSGGGVARFDWCGNGCAVMPPGVDDHCN